MESSESFLVPLPLSEMLHVALGSLTNVLKDEGHRWVPFLDSILKSYCTSRDDLIAWRYGEAAVAQANSVTQSVSEELCRWADTFDRENEDFTKWSQELKDDET